MSLLLEIVTPEKKAYTGTVDALTLPSVEGEIGILPGHIPMIVALKPGEIAVESQGVREMLAVDQGFAQIWGEKVSVLTEGAIDIQEIDLEAVEAAQKNAEEALAQAKEKDQDPADIEQLEQIIRFSIAQKLLKKQK